jgi:hypothetical protein
VINNYKPINNYITGGRSVPRSGAGRNALFRGMSLFYALLEGIEWSFGLI